MIILARELTDEEKKLYDHMLEGAKQLNIFGEEEELDARDFIIELWEREAEK